MQLDLFEQQIVKKVRSQQNKDNGDSIPAFLLKTYEIIDNPQNKDIISWNEEGSAFIVKKVNEFSDIILPKSFKHNNFASFVRQLNMYDFHKTRHDNNENEFKHKLFQRSKKHLLSQIKRKTNEVKEQNSLSLIKNEQIRSEQSETPEILMQMGKLQNKQLELEKLIKIFIKQNEKVMKENKYLWSELTKNKHKNENSEEQIMKWVLQSLQGTKQNNKLKSSLQANNLLMLKQTCENEDEMQVEAQNQKHFETEKLQFDQLPSQIISQNLEQQIEKLSKTQIIQVLLSAITNNQKQEKKNNIKFDDDLSFDDEYPVIKKMDLKQESQDKKQENQLIVYNEPYFFHKFEDNYVNSESPNPSRKNSYFDQDPIPQFLDSEL
ncbi:unnamed protein product (macronuclear) [Paramecium tetraurelia]|uniref:HSF-type DNA-binding domain-containing protein n=1 Tax=Paramecium tetraurelia TaxID=5888 RepID=A0EEF5_PARTE|nr:uncharacterized protein GSPATT00026018001 [Paramecium tetraurelia]CAK93678.1 unnamed protein product [Paramecium tetraurelia]|eukprot:XP_001461069.1 hypothetical protein (macronuclear) [Paramecium tetraurelia strain d4-2]